MIGQFRGSSGIGWFLLFLIVASVDVNAQTVSVARLHSTISNETTCGILLRNKLDGWLPAKSGWSLHPGDKFRAGDHPVIIRWHEGRIWTLQRRFLISIPESKEASMFSRIRKGLAYFYNRDEGGSVDIGGVALLTVRGTEFVIEDSETDGVTVSVLDGRIDVQALNRQSVLRNEAVTIKDGRVSLPRPIEARNVIQWMLYYPAILNVADVQGLLSTPVTEPAISAYLSGNVREAYTLRPENVLAVTPSERLFLGAVSLGAGDVAQCLELLAGADLQEADLKPLFDALRQLIASVKGEVFARTTPPKTSTEWLAESYYQQSRAGMITEQPYSSLEFALYGTPHGQDHRLRNSLTAAQKASELAPSWAFAKVRIAELMMSVGDAGAAEKVLAPVLNGPYTNAHAFATAGFIAAANLKWSEAKQWFTSAVQTDNKLGNGWLGLGLLAMREGDVAEAVLHITTAVNAEPQRAILRAYLGKAIYEAGRDLWRPFKGETVSPHFDLPTSSARKELKIAEGLDPNDPTALLYDALLDYDEYRNNDAIRKLEESRQLTGNRGLYRSANLLDQDRAVRSANLARIYRDSGLLQWSLNEAGRAVNEDYGNYSAHLFLANSFNAFRDPTLGNLRYEAATFSEYLIANLLAPPGAAHLSRTVSEHEYSRLFERDRFGFSYSSSFLTAGDWSQGAVQYGNVGKLSYAIEGNYRSLTDLGPELTEQSASVQIKQGLTGRSDVYLQVTASDIDVEDPNFNGNSALPAFRSSEEQIPNVFAGYHYEWTPSSHLLVLASRLRSEFNLEETRVAAKMISRLTNEIDNFPDSPFNQVFQSQFEATIGEIQQIWKTDWHTLVAGGGWQDGTVNSEQQTFFLGLPILSYFFDDPKSTNVTQKSDWQRGKLYIHDTWWADDDLWITVGLSYDRLYFPSATQNVPLHSTDEVKDQLSPRAGVLWRIHPSTSLKAAYSHSLGGLFFENSVRLEPTQIAGLTHAYRTALPIGSVPGEELKIANAGSDSKLGTNIFFGWRAELLRSAGEVPLARFDARQIPALPSSITQELDYEERSLQVYANRLVGDYLSFGLSYELMAARLEAIIPELEPYIGDQPGEFPLGDVSQISEFTIHEVGVTAQFNHYSGIFANAEAIWHQQKTHIHSQRDRDSFWYFNTYIGYRFPQRRAQILVGIINLGDEDFRVSSLNPNGVPFRGRSGIVNFRLDL